MKYMLLIYSAEDSWTGQQRQACLDKSTEICNQLQAEGKLIDASPLHPVDTATSIRVRNSQCQITDGPFAETTEQLGGYYIIDVADLDQAIAIAKRLPPAQKGTVEIRPVMDLSAGSTPQ